MHARLTGMAIAFSLTSILLSCNKNQESQSSIATTNHLQYDGDLLLKIGQAIQFYDKTALNDSLSYVQPPTNRYYEWKVMPDNGCVIFSGHFKYGKPDVTFNCPGTYQLSASLFDSASKKQIGKTDTLFVDVSTDILHYAQPVNVNDELGITASLSKAWFDVQPSDSFPPTRPPDALYISLQLETTAQYEYTSYNTHIPIASSISKNNYSYVFSDSVKLVSYPFSNGIGTFNKIQEYINIEGLEFGVPADLSIAWLGKTYTGKITLISDKEFVVKWNNNAPVKFNILINGRLTEQ